MSLLLLVEQGSEALGSVGSQIGCEWGQSVALCTAIGPIPDACTYSLSITVGVI